MGLRVAGSGYIQTNAAATPTSADNWAIAAWYTQNSSRGVIECPLVFNGSGGVIGKIQINTDNTVLIGTASGNSWTFHTITVGKPCLLIMRCASGTITGYARDYDMSSFNTITQARSSQTPSNVQLGGLDWGQQCDGVLDGVSIFNANITTQIIDSLFATRHRPRAGTVIAYTRCDRNPPPNEVPGGGTFTVNGTWTLESRQNLPTFGNPVLRSILVPLTPIEGVGAVTVPVPTVAATGTTTVQGAGSVAVPTPSIAAAGTSTDQGAAAVVVPVPAAAASGTTTVQGAGSVAVPVLSVAAAGAAGAVEGVGVVAVPVPGVTAAGQTPAPPPPPPAPGGLAGGGGRATVTIDGQTYVGTYRDIARLVELQAQREAQPQADRKIARRDARAAARSLTERLVIEAPIAIDTTPSAVVTDRMFRDLRDAYVDAYIQHALGLQRLMIDEQNRVAIEIATKTLL